MTRRNLDWQRVILPHAADIVNSYDTGVTLRQLFYRLVADTTLPNIQTKYRNLSSVTAKARREGTFPELLDRQSRIECYQSFTSTADALRYLSRIYRRDRTEGQDWNIYLGVEKAGLYTQLDAWFGDRLGLPIVALGGYASQSLCDKMRSDIIADGRSSVLLYAGDMDPTGEDIDRDFVKRVGFFDKVIRVALHEDQVHEYDLPFDPDPEVIKKLEDDPRAQGFMDRHGIYDTDDLVQYEVDALDPETLRDLYQNAIDLFWNDDAHAAVLEREDADIAELGAER
jgi:hypothetical protein